MVEEEVEGEEEIECMMRVREEEEVEEVEG